MTMTQCLECGANYDGSGESCATRFAALLGLDHSRQEPWGSRHGQAFSAFALQHPATYASSLDRAWAALFLIYAMHTDPRYIFSVLRAYPHGIPPGWAVPPRPTQWTHYPEITIADLADFAADTYSDQLDAWCQATLAALGIGHP
ncbi:MAG: hypothetical protein NVSMB53_06220 [Gemmatimonadaceae bacterium]